ncbi:unnamed protein product [Cercopithifilaria johnstoni]|uniref:Uncharacterized protein n=1 Tax=Cercopithifilaria johnstoni TaxID=2874296 RepID=A0A8J2Q5I1_9BILA|nr:unnamed protein product [Cercopithifilaria johnstoni]
MTPRKKHGIISSQCFINSNNEKSASTGSVANAQESSSLGRKEVKRGGRDSSDATMTAAFPKAHGVENASRCSGLENTGNTTSPHFHKSVTPPNTDCAKAHLLR